MHTSVGVHIPTTTPIRIHACMLRGQKVIADCSRISTKLLSNLVNELGELLGTLVGFKLNFGFIVAS
jgi:hypothetical protein